MKTRAFKVLLISLFFVACYPLLAAAASADDEVARIQKAYEHIKDIKGNFTQKSFIKDLKRTDAYKGRFFIKPPKMKWEYGGNKPQVIYVTGEDIIIYQKNEKQVFTAKFDRATYGQAPLALLSGLGNVKKEFAVSANKGGLVLKPKKPMGNIAYIELIVSSGSFPIGGMTITDNLANKIEISLKDVQINTGIREKVFEFYPPEGVNILQQ